MEEIFKSLNLFSFPFLILKHICLSSEVCDSVFLLKQFFLISIKVPNKAR